MGMGKGGILEGRGERNRGCLSLGVCFSPLHVGFAREMHSSPKGNQPPSPLKAKGSPSRTFGGRG